MKFPGSHTREVVFRALWLPGLALLAAPSVGTGSGPPCMSYGCTQPFAEELMPQAGTILGGRPHHQSHLSGEKVVRELVRGPGAHRPRPV